MKTTNIITFIFLLTSVHVTAQEKVPKPVSLKRLEVMKGKWAGSGWVQRGPGPKYSFNQTEHVYPKLSGQLLIVDGQGTDTETGEVTFQAFGVFKAKTDSTFQFSAYTNEGNYTLAEAAFEDDVLVWWFKLENGATIRYEIQLSKDTWIEDGYYIKSPEAKYPMFHMELKRQ